MHIKKTIPLTALFGLVCLVYPMYAAGPVVKAIEAHADGQVEVWLDRLLPNDGLHQNTQWHLLENGQKVELISWEEVQTADGINAVLIFDHSSGWAGTPFRWENVQRMLARTIGSFDPARDSLALVGFGSEVDMNTDLTDNFEVLRMILNGAEPVPGQAMTAAIQTAKAALALHHGHKAIFVVSSGYTERGMGEILRSVDVPVYLIAPGYKEDWAFFSWQTGGLYHKLDLLMNGQQELARLRDWPTAGMKIVYHSDLPVQEARELELFAAGLASDGPLASFRYNGPTVAAAPDIDGGSTVPANRKGAHWLWYGLGGLLGLALLFWLVRYLRFRTSSGTVQPGITDLEYVAQKHILLASVNIPIRTKPAKFTLHNHSGTPVRDMVISGTRRKVKMSLEGLPKGIYKCSLSNAGMTSEQREIVLG